MSLEAEDERTEGMQADKGLQPAAPPACNSGVLISAVRGRLSAAPYCMIFRIKVCRSEPSAKSFPGSHSVTTPGRNLVPLKNVP